MLVTVRRQRHLWLKVTSVRFICPRNHSGFLEVHSTWLIDSSQATAMLLFFPPVCLKWILLRTCWYKYLLLQKSLHLLVMGSLDRGILTWKCLLTPPMLRLFSSKAQGRWELWKPSKLYLVGIHWITLTEYSQMSTHVPGFPSFFWGFSSGLFASFYTGQISHQQHT